MTFLQALGSCWVLQNLFVLQDEQTQLPQPSLKTMQGCKIPAKIKSNLPTETQWLSSGTSISVFLNYRSYRYS